MTDQAARIRKAFSHWTPGHPFTVEFSVKLAILDNDLWNAMRDLRDEALCRGWWIEQRPAADSAEGVFRFGFKPPPKYAQP